MQLLRTRGRVATPWKNGGGITYEIAHFPPGSDFTNFLWRLSIAEVASPGPFSHFENVDRLFAVLDGSIALEFADRTMEVDAKCAPIAFAGEASCMATPIGGAVTDLNLMLRRGKAQGQMRRASGRVTTQTAATFVVAPKPLSLAVDARRVALERYDVLHLDGPCEVDLGGEALVVAIA